MTNILVLSIPHNDLLQSAHLTHTSLFLILICSHILVLHYFYDKLLAAPITQIKLKHRKKVSDTLVPRRDVTYQISLCGYNLIIPAQGQFGK